MKPRQNDREPKTNRRIRAPKVKVIDAEGTMLGIMDTREALARAQEQGLDLVEVNAKTDPPVCKILDYGKFKYDQAKKERESRKNRATQELKEVKFGVQIGEHDFDVKVRAARQFVADGHRVKLIAQFRGRQMMHPETGKDVLDRACKTLADSIVVILPAVMEGRHMSMTVGPNPKTKATQRQEESTTVDSTKASA